MRTYRVDVERGAQRWWVISVPEVKGAHSQARTLREVEVMARDVITLMEEIPEDSFEVDVHVHMPSDVRRLLEQSARLREKAAQQQSEAALAARLAARCLREDGMSLRDIGTVLGISFQRAKQLIDESKHLESKDLIDA